jgi:hypothetical protein
MNNTPNPRRASSNLLLIGAMLALLGLSLLAAQAHRRTISSQNVYLRFENVTPGTNPADSQTLALEPREAGLTPKQFVTGQGDSVRLGAYNLYITHGKQQAALALDLYTLLAPYPGTRELIIKADGHLKGTLLVQFVALDAAGNATQ